MTWMTKRSELDHFNGVEWTREDEQYLRDIVEKLFRQRTPCSNNDVYSARWETRVGRSEMRSWSTNYIGKLPPETDAEWCQQFADWYFEMARRVVAEQDPEMLYQVTR